MDLRGFGALVFLAEVALAAVCSAIVGFLSALAGAAGPRLSEYHGPVTPLSDAQRSEAEHGGEIAFMLTFDVALALLVVASAVLASVWRAALAARHGQLGFERPAYGALSLDYAFALTLAQAFIFGGFGLIIRRSPAGFAAWELLLLAVAAGLGLAGCLDPSSQSRRLAIGAGLVILLAHVGSGLAEPVLFLRPTFALQIFAFLLLLRRSDLALRTE